MKSAKTPPSYEQRMKWFHQARFGMFIHWGLYSILGRGEWAMFKERIPADEYARLADRFDPGKFDADAWVRLAKSAGMKYMVLTTRHHDGFCLYDSKVSDFTSTKTRAGRDFVGEYVKACRRHGLKVGLYYSLLDWRFPGYFEPRRYRKNAQALVQQTHDQVREILSNYGKIDILWYDGDWICHGRRKVNVPEFWRSRELNAMARRLQPHILINNRAGTQEDLDTPEQHVKASAPGRGWESCMTIGDSCGWGYLTHSPNMKTVPTLIQTLVQAAAGEGNFLLNIGPKPDGSVRKEETDRLQAMGAWLKINGEAIYGSQRCPVNEPTSMGQWIRKGKTVYLIVLRWPGREAVIPLAGTRLRHPELLGSKRKLSLSHASNGRVIVGNLPEKPPHAVASVLKFRSDRVPFQKDENRNYAAWINGQA